MWHLEHSELKQGNAAVQQFCRKNKTQLCNWLLREHHCPPEELGNLYSAVLKQLKTAVPTGEVHSETYIWEVFSTISIKILRKREKLMSKNFGLTEAAFEELKSALQAGDRSLFEKVFLGNFEGTVLFLIKKHGIQRADAYDISMEALLLFYQKLKDNKLYYGNLRFLLLQMANQIYLKQQQSGKAHSYIDEMKVDALEEKEIVDPQMVEMLNKALGKLCESCRQLMLAVYYEGWSLKKIADDLNKKPEAIRKQKQRCMEKLRTAFKELNK